MLSISVDESNAIYKSPDNCNAIISQNGRLLSGCKNTKIPDGVKDIYESAFENIVSLTDISIPQSVNTIGAAAFSGCTNITSIVLPNNVNTIGESAFSKCSNLKTVKLSEETKQIYRYAFSGCSSLYSIIIPKNVTDIGYGAFNRCSSLTSIIVDDANRFFDSRNNCNAIIQTDNNSLITGCENTIIPYGVTSIETSAFSGCIGLDFIALPNSIKTIKESAFAGCENLLSVTLPKNLNTIGLYVFSGCKRLTELYCCAEITPEFVSTPFIDDTLMVKAILYVPNQSVELYRTNSQWNKFKEIRPLSGHPFTLRYFIDDVEYKTCEYVYGTSVTPEAIPTKEGYTFSGWSEIPETMPAHDVTVTGSFSVNKYQVTYIIDGEVFSTESVEYGATIVSPTVEDKEGYTFSGWADVPETMPAHDITIYGNFTSGIAEISIDNAAGTIIYTINGKRISRLQRGVNIVRTSDGKVKKVIVK